jgi:hypothetical protein
MLMIQRRFDPVFLVRGASLNDRFPFPSLLLGFPLRREDRKGKGNVVVTGVT